MAVYTITCGVSKKLSYVCERELEGERTKQDMFYYSLISSSNFFARSSGFKQAANTVGYRSVGFHHCTRPLLLLTNRNRFD